MDGAQSLHILEIVQSLEKGGRTVRFASTVDGFRAQGYQVSAICLSQPEPWVEIEDLIVIQRSPGINWRLVLKLRAFIVSHKVDVVHAHCEFTQLYAGLACRSVGIACVGTFHRSERFRYQLSKSNIVIRACLQGFIAVSENRLGLLRNHLGIADKKSFVVHGGTPLSEPISAEEVAQLKRELNLPEQQHVLFSLGHLGEIKGHQDSIRALAQIAPEFPDAHLYIGGDGNSQQKTKLVELTKELGLEQRVHFLGQISNASTWMQCCQVFLQPSVDEAFGLVFIEAGAASRPVVATAVGGIQEIIINEKTGLLVDAQSPTQIAQALTTLLQQPQFAAEMGAAGYQRVADNFSVESMISGYLNIFKQLNIIKD